MHKVYSQIKGIDLKQYIICSYGIDFLNYYCFDGDGGTIEGRANAGNGCGYEGILLNYNGDGNSGCRIDCDEFTYTVYFLDEAL
jgi:hypothetical protein